MKITFYGTRDYDHLYFDVLAADPEYGCDIRFLAANLDKDTAPLAAGGEAVCGMVEQGLLVLTPAPGGKRAKNLNLTEAGRALAEKTIARVVRAEAAAICRMGLERMETDLAIRQGYLQKLREEVTQLKEKTDGHKTENL